MAGTAMAVPLFHKKSYYSENCSWVLFLLRSSTQVSRRTRSSGSSSIDTHEQTPVRARVSNVYVYAHACTCLRDRDIGIVYV